MNEIDLYVELLDDKAASKILKDFSQMVPGGFKNPTLRQKKTHIKNILRGQTTNIRKKRGVDPYFNHLAIYRSPENESQFSSMEPKVLFRTLYNSKIIPDHAKMALAQIYQPAALKVMLPQIIKNVQENKPAFALETGFDTEEEVEEYLRTTSNYVGVEGISYFLNDMKTRFSDEEIVRLSELESMIEQMTLLEFENRHHEFEQDPSYLVYYAYLVTHTGIAEDLRLGMALHVANHFITHHQKNHSGIVTQLDRLELELKQLSHLVNENEELNEKLKELKEKVKEQDKRKKQLEKEFREQSLSIERSNNLIKKLDADYAKQIEAQKVSQEKQVEQLQRQADELKRQLKESTQKRDRIIEEFRVEQQMEHFAVVCKVDNDFLKVFYPEITTLSLKEWDKKKTNISKFSQIYFQRDALNTTMIYSIQDFCSLNGIEAKYIHARNTKELIERIAFEKQQLLEVY
ncbi:hypothetical protein DX130_03230 [Paenibacillus paeoniae]|uniref:Uncharacterized protein n=2 Tax=Paenibacillus paeoniae TaxID=2292705 RepID=A0A371PIX1_9BACL|nr:hypothetical protein DX130_03230 [Paenibacillus paeoniae]